MIRRFCSGSVTPASRSRNNCEASATVELDSELAREYLLPSARARRRAAARYRRTRTSTGRRPRDGSAPPPPTNPPRPTGPSGRDLRAPTRARISATLVSMKFAIVQSPGSPQILMHEIAQHLRPARRMHDLGMELDAAHAPVAAAHRGVRRIVAVGDRAQAGRESPRPGRHGSSRPDVRGPSSPSNSGSCASMLSVAGPYSRACERRRCARPRCCAITYMP